MTELGFQMQLDEPPTRRRTLPWIIGAAVLALVVIVGVILAARSVTGPVDFEGPGTGTVAVDVAGGASITEIANSLVAAGVIANAQPFIDQAALQSGSISPGRYAMHAQMGPKEAFALMLDPSSRTASRLVIKEGQRLKQIVAESSRVSGVPVSNFETALTRPNAIGLPAAAGGNPEGWLFPATYDVGAKATATSILRQMTARFEQEAQTINLAARARAAGHTQEEIVTIASILEVESNPADYAKVARVINNRLAAGMKLQLDSTVNYALGTERLHLSAEDLAVDSPYNTYLVTGLPPGPINSPGEAALEAALAPAPGNWLYFITVDPKTGRTVFTHSEAEFLKYKKQFQQGSP